MVSSDDTRMAVRILNACSRVSMSVIVQNLFGALAEVMAITWPSMMVIWSGLWSPSKSARLTYSHFLVWSTNRQGTGEISSVTTTAGGFIGSTTGCTAKVSVKVMGADVVLRDTVDVVVISLISNKLIRISVCGRTPSHYTEAICFLHLKITHIYYKANYIELHTYIVIKTCQ